MIVSALLLPILIACTLEGLDSRYQDRPEGGAFPQPGRSVSLQLTLGY